MGFNPHDYYIKQINLQTKSSKSLPLLPHGPIMQMKLTEALNFSPTVVNTGGMLCESEAKQCTV